MSIEHWDDPQLNQQLLQILDDAVAKCEKLYEGKARSFAAILNEMEILSAQLHMKLNVANEDDLPVSPTLTSTADESSPQAQKKWVYIRLFHREMANLAIPKAPKVWLKSLLESIKHSEQHGLAVYADEDDVKRSLKGDNYGYVTVAIDAEDDVSAKRPPRQDPNIHCPLLTLGPIKLDQIVKLTYRDLDYPVIDGVLKRPKNAHHEHDD